MNWVTALCDLYEKNESHAGKFDISNDEKKKPLVLLPLAHTTVLAQIEVSIDGQGNFLRAKKLSKEEALTLIPVSESSAIRTSGQAPHPLMDTLQYIAGDYDIYIRAKIDKKTKQPKIVSFRSRYDEFINNLEDWCDSIYVHRKAICILHYLKKACLLKDLIREQVLLVDTDGLLLPDLKIQSVLQEKSFVRFCVETGDTPDFNDDSGSFFSEVWKDTTLQKSYTDYFISRPENIGLCYLSGYTGPTTNSFPKKIRHDGDGAKILSSNDNDGFTFRGRFNNSNEAFSIGYESSQKAQNALNWIIRKQGYLRNGLCVVAWESNLKPYVSIFGDAADAVIAAHVDNLYDGAIEGIGGVNGDGVSGGGSVNCNGISGAIGGGNAYNSDNDSDIISNSNSDSDYGYDNYDYVDDNEDNGDDYGDNNFDNELYQQDTNSVTADHFNKALDGFIKNVDNTSNMVVMALDAATQGRLAITYFNRMPYSHYIENIAFWHHSCCWRHAKFINKKLVFYEGMASMYEIALALYGSEQDGLMKLRTDSNRRSPMLVATFQKLAPCMLERKRIPKDLVFVAFARASSPLAYQKNNWRRILSIACSIVKKTKYDWEGEERNMALELDCTDRSYLYGRLLAVADVVEEATFDANEEKRETNAMRYMNAFSRRPFRTWQVIEERLRPYFSKLPIQYRNRYKYMLREIKDKFDTKNFSDDSTLDGLYLLGFHSQINYIYTKKESVVTTDLINEQEGGNE